MKRIFRDFDEQYLLQTAADLASRRAELEKLKDSLKEAEASKRSYKIQTSSDSFVSPA